MIQRDLAARILYLAGHFPVVTVTGPRQSGKTTLCRALFPGLPCVSLETPEKRDFALSDPRGFLAQFPDGAVLDEVQRAPDLFSYLQEIVDTNQRNGEWILTGSQHFGLLESISQSLAGRTAVVHLLPPSLGELRRFSEVPEGLFATLFAGAYPRIHERSVPPRDWLAQYVTTYVERDVRSVLDVGDLITFQSFLKLCAGRAGQLVNLASLGADCGIAQKTARSWLSVLETSFIVFRLPPYYRNLGKRVTKSPKLHFYDSGLLCYLLGIQEPGQLLQHPLRGAIFESWVVSEIAKVRLNQGLSPDLYFFRDRRGAEVDLLLESGPTSVAVEIKSGQTVSSDFFAALMSFVAIAAKAGMTVKPVVVYGGDEAQDRKAAMVLPWSEIDAYEWAPKPDALGGNP